MVEPASSTTPYSMSNLSWYTTGSTPYLVYNGNTSQNPAIIQAGTYTYNCEPGRAMNLYIKGIQDGTQINYTLTLTSGHTITGWIMQNGDEWYNLGNHKLALCMDTSEMRFDTGVMISGTSNVLFNYYEEPNNPGEIYLVMSNAQAMGMYMPYKYEAITGVTITSNDIVEYHIATFDISAYANGEKPSDIFTVITDYIGLIGEIFGTFISIILILKVIFIDNFFMVLGFGELGILIISLRQNPKDIFGFANDAIQYNVRFVSFIVDLLTKFVNGFLIVVQIMYNIAKSIPFIGAFL
jgi:hypothetical protein